jgi:hypothetical protein
MPRTPKRTKFEQDVIESFQIVLDQIADLRDQHEALKLTLAGKGLFSKKDFELALEVVREEHQRQTDALVTAIKMFRSHDAVLASNPGAKKTRQ